MNPIYFPATDAEFRRILAQDQDRAPVLCEATHDEFLRIVTTSRGPGPTSAGKWTSGPDQGRVGDRHPHG